MPRTTIRTATLVLDDIAKITDLFGTIMNAHRRLGLDSIVPYQHFYRAMHFRNITPKHKEEIEAAWERWKLLFLKNEVPPSDDLAVTSYNRDILPEWHPDSLVNKELVND